MQIKTYNSLAEEQRRRIYTSINSKSNYYSPQTFEDMEKFYGGIAFDDGRSHFSLWEDDELVGTLGVVSKDAAVRGEVFLIGLNLEKSNGDKLDLLLSKVFEYCSHIDSASYKLGIMPDMNHLIPYVLKNGFKEAYRLLEMKYHRKASQLIPNIDNGFETLSSSNVKQLQEVHNKSFLSSPNGAIMEDEELQELLAECSSSPELAGVYLEGNRPAGMYILKIKNNVGWIDGIGVAPSFQGKGIGKKLLQKSVRVLTEAGVNEIRLSVFDINRNAVGLYLNNGFNIEREHSVWYEK